MIYAYILENGQIASTYDKIYIPDNINYQEIEGDWPTELAIDSNNKIYIDTNAIYNKPIQKQIDSILAELKQTDIQMPRAMEDIIANMSGYTPADSQKELIAHKVELRQQLSNLKGQLK